MRKMKRSVALVLVLCLSVVLFAGCGKEKTTETTAAPTPTTPENLTYTITVKTADGLFLEGVAVVVYGDNTMQEPVALEKTDAQGKMSFTAVKKDTYVAQLADLPEGYTAEGLFPLTGTETEIVLTNGEIPTSENVTYKLGDAMMNFTVVSTQGTEYTFNDLIQDKKAVVLNFFYNNCQPCKTEFPYLQEAYEQYRDEIALLAMNPVDNDVAAIEALRKELGLTFPMVACDPQWEAAMQITGYPTTVIIDRFGTISLIHKGGVPDAKTFADAFAYFTAEDYEPKLIEKIEDLAAEEEGTKENPTEIGGVSSFEVTVEAGQVIYLDIYKVTKMYLKIKSDSAYIIYKDKTYYPKNGEVSVMISAPDSFTPTQVAIGNSGSKTETYKATIQAPVGTFDNPNKLKLGDFKAKVAAGNEQGVYYIYKATEDGTLTVKCTGVTKGVKYDFYLYNTTTGAMRNLESDSTTDENGNVSVSVQAKKGHRIQLCISSLPDDKGSYPAATFQMSAAFTAGEITEQEQVKTTEYTVTVTDGTNPLANVSVILKVDGADTALSTDAAGVAKITLPSGSYEGTFYIPDGYSAETTAFALTEEAPNVVLKVSRIQKMNYSVTVCDENGKPMSGVFVKIGSGVWQTTDAAGAVILTLDTGSYDVTLMLPEDYTGETAYRFGEGETALQVRLTKLTGSLQKPEVLTQLGMLGQKELVAGDADGYYYSYTAAEAGIFSLQVKNEPAAAYDIALINGDKTALMSQSGVSREVSLQVAAGDTVIIRLYALEVDGTYPALELRLWTTVKPLPIDPEDPDQPENPEDPEETTPDTTEPEPSVPETTEPTRKNYTVTVTDAFGAAQKDIGVIFLKNGTPLKMSTTDENGTVTLETTESETISVELVFNDAVYYYDKAAAVLTPDAQQLSIKLAAMLDENDNLPLYILNGNPAYTLYVGGTHVELGSGKPNFSAEYENNCFFVFTPEVAGTYQITATPNVELSYWNTPAFISKFFSSEEEGRDHALTMSISGDSVGHITYVIGVKADTALTDTVINVARIGEPEFSIAAQPWTEWETGAAHTDAWMKETGTALSKDGKSYTYSFEVQYLDFAAPDGTYALYYDEANGYYRLSENGPVVLVDLGAEDRFVPLFERINGKDAYGGSAVTRYFYDSTGAFVKKENYTEFLSACFDEMLMTKSNPKGYYPLTQDLMYVLQNGFVGWWDAESPNFLGGFAEANPNYAWMFACCTVK